MQGNLRKVADTNASGHQTSSKTLGRRRSLMLLIASLLVASLKLSSSLAATSGIAELQSVGTIAYYPSVVKLMGTECGGRVRPELTAPLFDLMKSSGANVFMQGFYTDNWARDQSGLIQIRQWCKDRGITFYLLCSGTHWIDESTPEGETWAIMKYNIIFNVNGVGDSVINTVSDMIVKLQPDMVHILDEPDYTHTSYDPTTYFNQYRQFCIRALQAYRAIKADLMISVAGCPFWNMHDLAANPIPGADFYVFADYYSYGGSYPSSTRELAYWNAQTPAALASAKRLLYDTWLNPLGLQACLNKGLKLLFACGGCNSNPNILVYMQDFYDFCKARSIGVFGMSLMPYPTYSVGMLDGTGWAGGPYPTKLNSLGELWAKNMKG